MKAEHYHFITLGINRLNALRQFRQNNAVKTKLARDNQGASAAVSIDVGGQIQHCSSRANPVDESIREAYEAGDKAILAEIKNGVTEAEKLMVAKLKEYGVTFEEEA